jgi:hypothetical protein
MGVPHMKITIRNLGVIKEAEFDLKPLTIFVGPNNAGKTWLAYTLGGIFGTFGFLEYLRAYQIGEVPKAFYPLDHAVEQMQKNGSASIDLVQFVEEYGELFYNNVAHYSRQWLPQFMGTKEVSFEEFEVTINLADVKEALVRRVLSFNTKTEIPAGRPLLNIRKKEGERVLYAFTSTQSASSETFSEEQAIEILPPDIIKDFLIQSVFGLLHLILYPSVHTLPTERTTFITFPFTVNSVKAGPLTFVNQPVERDSSMSARRVLVPVGSFLSMIQSSFESNSEERAQRERMRKENSSVKKYIQLARLLEQEILYGEVQVSQPTKDLPATEFGSSRQVLFQPTAKKRKLEVSIASSMVKELSPLVIYLRYLALPGELLIIDEPEMNLHPEAQVKMIEFIAMLINAGLNVLITTHSPYVIDHLVNLIKANKSEDKDSIRNEFYLKQTEAFISQHKVSVYLIDQGKATNVMDEDGALELNTFGEVSDRISEIYFKL